MSGLQGKPRACAKTLLEVDQTFSSSITVHSTVVCLLCADMGSLGGVKVYGPLFINDFIRI